LEGYVFLSALRVFHGQSVYPHPSLQFIPYMYPPGYYYLCAALGRLMGMSIATMRMASILSTLGCFAAIYGLVWSEVRRHMPAIAAAGLYAGCYVVCLEWFDLGRLDSLFVLLLLLVAVIAQEAAGVYNPGNYLPTVEDNNSLVALVVQIRGISGEIYVAEHPYYAWLAGKPTQADEVSILDATNTSTSTSVKEELRTELRTALTRRRFAALAFDDIEVEDKIDMMVAQREDWQGCYRIEENTFAVEPKVQSKWMIARIVPSDAGCAPKPGTDY
jgi:hypothetical protein